jgi:formylglycine-generating enzyme required for sulfatase activity
MQRAFLILFLSLFACVLMADASVKPWGPVTSEANDEAVFPHPFVDIMHAQHEGGFYDQQAEDWKEVATGDCSTDEAWFHYFKTANYSNRFGSGEHDLTAILAAGAKVMDPNDFYLPYLRFAANKHPTERWNDLLVAYANGPDHHECYSGMAAYYESRGETEERNTILEKLHQVYPIPVGVMEYNFNQLMSVGNNGILLTNGDADTYPSWVLQFAYGVRQDVYVASIPMLRGYPDLRKSFLAKFGLNDPYPADGPAPSVPELLELLARQSMPVYLAATSRGYLDELPKEKLYLSGLAFYYGNSPIDNLEILADNFERKFRMDQLLQPLSDGPIQAVADQLNQNYLPALLELFSYNRANPSPRFQRVLPLLRSLAERAGRTEEVNAYLRNENRSKLASSTPGVRAKDILKNIALIPNGIYKQFPEDPERSIGFFHIQETEVSNADYQLFLEDLLRQRRFDLLDSVAIASLDPLELEPESLRENAESHFVNSNHELLAKYPIVNVSHRAATLYARWLAETYNSDPKRKDGRNVRFRLPQAEEFAYAARGGRAKAVYPWGGPYYRNLRGCLLANFNTYLPESQADFEKFAQRVKNDTKLKAKDKAELLDKVNCDFESDGGVFTVAVDAYFPNDYGLYNMGGNAAEMTAIEGETIGGSWLDGSYYMQIGVTKQRSLPHSSTGFRLVMEYVD